MAHKTIELDNTTYTFQDRRTLGVLGRIEAFNRLADHRATDAAYAGIYNLIRACYAFTVNITGASEQAAFWALYGHQPASVVWDAALDTFTEIELAQWWQAYEAVQEKITDADFLAEGKPSTD